MQWRIASSMFLAVLLVLTTIHQAEAADLEKEMQRAIVRSRALVTELMKKEATLTASDRERIHAHADEMASMRLLLEERFRQRTGRTPAMGRQAVQRHEVMVERFRGFWDEYMCILDSIPPAGDAFRSRLEDLKALLDEFQPRQRQRIFGTMPVKHPGFAPRTPSVENTLVPAYLGGNKTVSTEDLTGAPEAPITREIALLAESLHWNPVEIYEWVKNNIDTEWYWGCMKGAIETLRQKRGNDSDQAALLVALMRAAGFPARYVRGVVGFFPGIEHARHLIGIADPQELAAFFQKAGIPCETVVAGGRIADIHIEHIWVEVQVPYANYRGSVIDENGKSWLGLDTALKPAGYLWTVPEIALDAFPWAGIRGDYLEKVREETLMGYLRDRIEDYLDDHRDLYPEAGYSDLLQTRALNPEILKILPASLQFRQIAVTGEHARMPDALVHTVRLTGRTDAGKELFDEVFPAYRLSNRQIALDAEPETVEDQETINACGGIGNTPAYLVRLRPSIRLDGNRLAAASDGLPMGEVFLLKVTLASPSGEEAFQNSHIVGAASVMTVVCGEAMPDEAVGEENGELSGEEAAGPEQILHAVGREYIDRWQDAESELAALMQLAILRPLPTVVTVGAVADVTWLLDSPHSLCVAGVYMDADLHAVESAGGSALLPDLDSDMLFMQLSGLAGSILEHRVPEDTFQVDGVSTAKLMGIAAGSGVALRTIDADTADMDLAGLPLPESVAADIRDAVGQGLVVVVPETGLFYEDWTGIGYIKEDPGTGASGWMLTGDIAGGMTAWSLDRWPDYYRSRLEIAPMDAAPNEDPEAAVHIDKITATDLQKGEVGQALERPFQVLVRDAAMRPVKGARVTFTIKAGGGVFADGASVLTVASDARGIAAAPFLLGRQTRVNPVMWWEPGDIHARQVGENIVEAELALGTAVDTPFTAYGLPGNPASIRRLFGDGTSWQILSWAGFVSVVVEDAYGNPVSNETVTFEALPSMEKTPCDRPDGDRRPAQLVEMEDPCIDGIPTYGECLSAADAVEVVTDVEGALAHVILGGVADADYPIRAVCKDFSTEFTLVSLPFGSCEEDAPPSVVVNLVDFFSTDAYGNNIDAGKTGSAITVKARLYNIRDGEAERTRTLACDGGPRTCTTVVAAGERVVSDHFEEMQVSFNGVAGTHVGGGIFEASYTLEPGRQTINIEAEVVVKMTRSRVSCTECTTRTVDRAFTASLSGKTVFGVDYHVPSEVMVMVDVDGFLMADKSFQLTCSEYTPLTHTVELMKDGAPVAFLPVARDADQDTVTIARGFQFDPEAVYTMAGVMNAGTGLEIRSDPFPVILCRMGDIFVEGEDGPVDAAPPGQRVTARVLPDDLPVTWSYALVFEGKTGVALDLDPATGVIHVDPESGNGKIRLRAEMTDAPGCFREAILPIGCPKCMTGTCDAEGGAECDLSCVDVRFSLGRAEGGISAGGIYLLSETLGTHLATPQALVFSTLASDVEPVYDASGVLRQVMAPKTFVDIVAAGPTAYEIRYFRPDDVVGRIDGRFETVPSALPFTVWRVESPEGGSGSIRRLDIERIAGDGGERYAYEWNEAENAWSLAKGGGLQKTIRTEARSGGDRIVTEIVTDESGIPAAVNRMVYRSFDWGEEIVEHREDPDGANLTTISNYYDDASDAGSYGRLREIVYPDGSWIRHTYDEMGRVRTEVRPWLDSPAGSPSGEARCVEYDYGPVDPADTGRRKDVRHTRTVTESVLGTIVSKTFHAFIYDPSGARTEITEQCAAAEAGYGDRGNLRTVRVYNPSDPSRPGWGRLQSVRHPDGRMDTYTYAFGTYSPGTGAGGGIFDSGQGDDLRIIRTSGTVDAPEGIPFNTTRETIIQNQRGLTLMRETAVYTGGGYERIGWTVETHDAFDRVTSVIRSDGTRTDTEWGCCGRTSETNAAGLRRVFEYDALKRVVAEIRPAAISERWPDQSEIRIQRTYDAAGRTASQTVTGGELVLASHTEYDLAGRIVSSTDVAGLTTEKFYAHGGRITTISRPGGATEITERHLDGQPKSVTGTGVVARYYTYGVNPDGSQWSRVTVGSPDSGLWETTITDLLGRTLRVEKPGPEGTETNWNRYDVNGRITAVAAPGHAETLTVYDDLGRPVRTGLDTDGNGILVPASRDRIRESEVAYAKIDGAWWQESVECIYAKDDDGTPTRTAIRRIRLTGLGAGGLTGESVAIDIHGNCTVQKTIVDRENQTTFRTIDTPDAETEMRTINFNGRVVSSTGKSGITTTFAYDALGRRTSATDPRTGTTQSHYDDQGRVAYVRDPAGYRTTFFYDAVTGRKVAVKDPSGKFTRYAYNDRGQLTRTWGDAVYPVQYVYDDVGRLVELHTYRGEAGWAGDTWPEGAAPDITRWRYDPDTGLLIAKVYADGTETTFDYTFGGRLVTRTWARTGAGGNPLQTAYVYDPATAELTMVDYSDDTVDIGFTYDRLGRRKTVTDAVGTRAFAYSSSLQLVSEAISGIYDEVMERKYAVAGVRGRPSGFSLGYGYIVNYGFDDGGRLDSLAWEAGGNSGMVDYAYLPDANLLAGYATPTGIRTAYTYEPHRNLKTRVENSGGSGIISAYDYRYDALGRRTSVVNTGTAFAESGLTRYRYNDRGELTAAERYFGTDPEAPGASVADHQRSYVYDPIGNRTASTGWDDSQAAQQRIIYETNALNQYTTLRKNGDENFPSYDADGNMTAYDGKEYTWNAENHLTSVAPMTPESGSKKVTFLYDYMGRRVRKQIFTHDGEAWHPDPKETRHFVYDGWNLIKETITKDDTTETKYYIWGLDLSQTLQGAGGIGGLICEVENGDAHYYFYDANGNVGQLVGEEKDEIAWRYGYAPYGDTADFSIHGIGSNHHRFSTKYYDEEIGLYYYGHRYYQPKMGRWLSRDPIVLFSYAIDHRNIYRFSFNEPISNIDPLGLESDNLFNREQVKFRDIEPISGIGDIFTGFRVVFGLVGSILDLDIFRSRGNSPINEASKDHCQFLLTINGIFNSSSASRDFPREVRNYLPDTLGQIENSGNVHNPTTWITDALVQIPFLEFGAIGTPSITAARYINDAYEIASKECCQCIDIYVFAHSQGAAVLNQAIPLISPEARGKMRILTIGAEQFIRNGKGQFAFIDNIDSENDFVPELSIRNTGLNETEIGNHYIPGHGRTNYLLYFQEHGLPQNFYQKIERECD